MNDYWRIWFEVYEDGKLIGAGVWQQYYKYKQNAVRRAKQMWDKDCYSPITKTTIHREWIVSQTNPWAIDHPQYDHDKVMQKLHELCD